MTRQQKRLLLWAFLFGVLASIAFNQAVHAQSKPIIELKGNETSPARVELGLSIFFDPDASKPPGVSCASCHDPARAFTTTAPAAIGVNGQVGRRNAPTILNACFKLRLFHDGRVRHLEGQAAFPFVAGGEMGQTVEGIAAYLEGQPEYVEMFEAAYGEPPSFMGAVKAVACFERELVSFNAPIDRWLDGETWALDERQKLGAAVFVNATAAKGYDDKAKLELMSSTKGPERWRVGAQGSCTSCHNGQDYADDFDGQLRPHNVGSAEYTVDKILAIMTQDGVGQVATPDDNKVVTPTLREHQLTGPYGFRGQWPTTEAVIDFKERGGDRTRNVSTLVRSYKWTAQEKADLAYFLKTAFAGDFKERIAELGIKVR